MLFACSGRTGSGAAHIFSTELQVSEAAPGFWERELPPGAFLITARERDIDFRMTVKVAGNSSSLADEIPRHGYQATVITRRDPELVRVALDNADDRDWKGSASLDIVRLRDADTPPDARELGFVSFGEGGIRLARVIYAERESSTQRFREAARHFSAAKDIAARADANYALAFTEYLLRMDNQAAVIASDQARADFEAAGNAVGVHDAIALHAMSDIEIGYTMNAAQKRAKRQQLFDSAVGRLRVGLSRLPGAGTRVFASRAGHRGSAGRTGPHSHPHRANVARTRRPLGGVLCRLPDLRTGRRSAENCPTAHTQRTRESGMVQLRCEGE